VGINYAQLLNLTAREIISALIRDGFGYDLSASSKRTSTPGDVNYHAEKIYGRLAAALLQGLVDLDIALQHFGHKLGKIDASLLGFTRKILPDAPLDGDWHQHFGAGRDVVEPTNTFTEVDLSWHVLTVR
jgi:hypothetical protein